VTGDRHSAASLTPQVNSALISIAADAVRKGDVDTLERALNAGVVTDAITPRGDSLLMLAAYYGHVDAVETLLARGADPNKTDAKGQTPLASRSKG
jgi:ankyrin repeat protein